MKTKTTGLTLLLYGVADRGDLVAMFFADRADVSDFQGSLPGRYNVMKVKGVDYDAIKIGKITAAKRQTERD